MTTKKLIVVLGMHRSGTSVITRALMAMGVALGDKLLPAMSGVNERGFWEDQDVLDINIELLGLGGYDWYDNAPGVRLGGAATELDALKRRAAGVLRDRLDGHALFAIKDPRTAVLLPFWKEVFNLVGCDIAFLIALRNPKSIVDSLVSRDGFGPIKILYLWLEHLLPSILETAGYPRMVIDYDLFMDDPEAQMRRIARGLRLDVDFDRDPAIAVFLGDFLENTLRHSRYSTDSLNGDRLVPGEVVDIFSSLLSMARDRIQPDDIEANHLFTRVDAHLTSMLPLFESINELERRLRRIKAEGMQAEILALERAVNEGNKQNAELRDSLFGCNARLETLEQNKRALEARLEDVSASFLGRLNRIFRG